MKEDVLQFILSQADYNSLRTYLKEKGFSIKGRPTKAELISYIIEHIDKINLHDMFNYLFTVDDLKYFLEYFNLPKSGRKSELIQRILEYIFEEKEEKKNVLEIEIPLEEEEELVETIDIRVYR